MSPSSLLRRVAASTALISVVRRPPASSVCSPAIAVPPGDVTMSLRWPGCWPVSRSSLADPSTVWAASDGVVARQTDFDARVGQRFDDKEHVGGARTRKTRHRIELIFIEHDGKTDRAEDLLRQLDVVFCRGVASRNRCGSCSDERWRVRHDPNHPRAFGRCDWKHFRWHARSDGNTQTVRL